jgi:hypothetical protein
MHAEQIAPGWLRRNPTISARIAPGTPNSHRNDTATFIQRSMVLKVRLYSRDGPTSTANLLAQHLTDYLDDAVRV